MCHCRSRTCGCAYYTFKRRYGFFSFCFDCLMLIATCGLWVVWIFVREMRA